MSNENTNTEKWVKLGLIAADPQFGTLQGKITEESFGRETKISCSIEQYFRAMVDSGSTFELFDPIILKMGRTQDGTPALGTAALVKDDDVLIPTEGDSIMINSKSVLWYAWIDENDQQWQQIVATTISGIDIAPGGNLGLDDDIIRFPGS